MALARMNHVAFFSEHLFSSFFLFMMYASFFPMNKVVPGYNDVRC